MQTDTKKIKEKQIFKSDLVGDNINVQIQARMASTLLVQILKLLYISVYRYIYIYIHKHPTHRKLCKHVMLKFTRLNVSFYNKYFQCFQLAKIQFRENNLIYK